MQYLGKKLRHELKYYIHYHEYHSLRQRLRILMTQDRNSISNEGYHIRSLYFDDAHDTALFEKNYGIFKRKKYRIRIYNRSDSVIKLERKNKFGEFINKESASLNRKEYEQIAKGDVEFLQESKQALPQQFYQGVLNHVLQPRVIVDYTREAYVLETGDVRVTFDKELSFVKNSIDIFDPTIVEVRAIQRPMLIMEVKYNEFLPQMVREVLQLSGHERSAISKYVICRERRLGHFYP